MLRQISIASVVIIYLSLGKVVGQGCSDPGICTSGTLNAANTQDSTSSIDFTEASLEDLMNATIASEKYRLGADLVYGKGDRGTAIYNMVLRGSIRFKEKVLLNVKLPLTYVTGDIGTTTGTGDLAITVQNTFKSGKNVNLDYTLGVILPTNSANLLYDDQVMPMAYQTSLGLFSVLAGMSMRYKTWSAVVGYQQSFGQNSNGFLVEQITLDTNSENYEHELARAQYFSSGKLSRTGDLIMRLEKGFRWKKINFAAGVLPILRIGTSSRVNAADERLSVEGSDGLTLNITAGVSYNINKSTFVKLNYGQPVIRRKVRPDGLTRSKVVILGVGVKIW